MSEAFLKGRVVLCCGDGFHFLRDQPENRYDSIVTDPPYALVSIVKRFGDKDRKAWEAIGNNHGGGASPYQRASVGFMGKQWDTGETGFDPAFWVECLRVLKPGAHVVAFGGTRTYHRLACAIEDAGFEIRDSLQWLYGSGFPKSHDVSKGIDRAAGAEREVVGVRSYAGGHVQRSSANKLAPPIGTFVRTQDDRLETVPSTDAANQWSGWGTALKPACEPICLARKPLSESTVAANVLKWGCGALNIDGCRVHTAGSEAKAYNVKRLKPGATLVAEGGNWRPDGDDAARYEGVTKDGRWPANIILDGSDEVVAAFPKRFWYGSKADQDSRLGSSHPTVKPVDLMQWLVRLVTPPGGLVLDCFAGTGTTAEACFREGMRCMLVEREAEYQADIRRRMALVMAGPDERVRESIKAKKLPEDHGPLFERAARVEDAE